MPTTTRDQSHAQRTIHKAILAEHESIWSVAVEMQLDVSFLITTEKTAVQEINVPIKR